MVGLISRPLSWLAISSAKLTAFAARVIYASGKAFCNVARDWWPHLKPLTAFYGRHLSGGALAPDPRLPAAPRCAAVEGVAFALGSRGGRIILAAELFMLSAHVGPGRAARTALGLAAACATGRAVWVLLHTSRSQPVLEPLAGEAVAALWPSEAAASRYACSTVSLAVERNNRVQLSRGEGIRVECSVCPFRMPHQGGVSNNQGELLLPCAVLIAPVRCPAASGDSIWDWEPPVGDPYASGAWHVLRALMRTVDM